jgi:hypothetical protein
VNRYRAYGLEIASVLTLPLRPSPGAREPDLHIDYCGRSEPLPSSGADRRRLSFSEAGWTLRYDNGQGGWMAFDYHAAHRRLRASGSVGWDDTEAPLSGVVLGVLLRAAGETLLHAACLETSGTAFAILGSSGAGKSTLAGALVAAGASLVTEDLLALRSGDTGYLAEAGAPTLHLLPDSQRSLALPHHLPRSTRNGKIRLELEPRSATAVPLGALFILGLREHSDSTTFQRLSGPRAVAAVAEHLYGSPWVRPAAPADLEFCARLTRDIPVMAVARPWSLAAVADTAVSLRQFAQMVSRPKPNP